MIVLFDVLTIIVSGIAFFSNIRKLRDGSRYVVFFVFWFIFVLPLILDYVLGFPDYYSLSSPSRFYGFSLSVKDETTRILYDFFLLISQLLLLKWKYVFTIGKKSKNKQLNENSEFLFSFSKKELIIVIIFSVLTPLLCVITGRSMIAFTFGWRELSLGQTIIEQGNYSLFEKLSYIGVTASSFLLFWKDANTRIPRFLKNVFAVLLLYSNICIEGKRSILFFALIICFMTQLYFDKSRYAVIKLFTAFVIISVVVIASSVYIKTLYRGYSSFDTLYTNIRIDLFRDDTVKLVIYSFLNKEIDPLLSWPFQSYITQLYSIFPIDILNGLGIIKLPRVGFNVYLSSALSRQSIETGVNYMTTSMADEMLSNFHVFGAFLFSIILVGFSNFIDEQTPFEKIMWIGLIVLLMIYPLSYIAYYIEAAVIVHLILKHKAKNKLKNNSFV